MFKVQLSMFDVRAAVVLACVLGTALNGAEAPAPTLWYTQPAAKWEEALPIGNGHMGAMVFGGTLDERIQFNEDTLWTGKPHNYVRAGSADVVPEVRSLLANGKIKEAQDLARAKILSDPVRQKAYQPFGDIRLRFAGHDNVTDYKRELNLDTAIATTSYQTGGVRFTRETFASYPDRVIVVRLSADQPGKLNLAIALDSPHKGSTSSAGLRPATITLAGRVQDDGLRFEAQLQVRAEGGVVRITNNTLEVEKSDRVTLVLVAATSFKTYEDISADPAVRCTTQLAAIQAKDYATLRQRHIADHQSLFRRNTIDLGTSAAAALPTNERLNRVRSAKSLDADPALAALHFQYGRYLLIASSRPGSQPANLQGVWNELLNPPWESKYTTNINYEMNYWLADLTGLGECFEPFTAAVDDLRASGARTAQQLYRSRGWVLHHNFDLWRGTAPINNIDGLWPTGAAWLCYQLWDHWLFTRDRAFLEQHAYPAMKEASLFFVDYLVRDTTHGWLLTSPSHSPEQGPSTAGPTMDNQLIRALWTSTIAAAHELQRDEDFAAELDELLPQLPANRIGQHGQLQEWIEDVDVPNNNHRHMSPLWALYPGADITPANAALYAGARKLLEWRGDGSTGWSFAWRMPLWARVGDGEMAYRQYAGLMTKKTLPNLFDLCGPFQIDGNFGATAGIVEMLLQSHQRTPGGLVIVDLVPALPKAWSTGSVQGLQARDGLRVDLSWKDGVLTEVTLHSQLGRPCLLRIHDTEITVNLPAGKSQRFDPHLRAL